MGEYQQTMAHLEGFDPRHPRHPGPTFGAAHFRPCSRVFGPVRCRFSKPIVLVGQTAANRRGCRRTPQNVVKLWSDGRLSTRPVARVL